MNFRTEPILKGQKPMKRRFHSSVIIEKKMFIFGGCHSTYKYLK